MANGFKFELDRQGVGQLLRSAEMQRVLESYGSRAVSRAGAGYKHGAYQGTDRVKVNVWAYTPEAIKDNQDNKTLLKAVRG